MSILTGASGKTKISLVLHEPYSQGKKGRGCMITVLVVCAVSKTHDCNTEAKRRLFLAVGFLAYVTFYKGAP